MPLILPKRLLINDDASAPYFINGNNGNNSANASSLSWTHTTTSDTTCLVFGGFIGRNSGTCSINSVSFNSLALTEAVGQSLSLVGGGIWYLLNPPTGTFTISMSCTGGDRGIAGSSINLGGVTGVDITGSTGASATTTNPMSTTITAVAGGLPVGNKISRNSGTSAVTYAALGPTGMTIAHTKNDWTSSSNRKYQALFYSDTLVSPGSTTFQTNLTAGGSITGTQQQYAIFK
jgi:hypothetical protein